MELAARTAQLAMLRGQSLNRTPNAGIFEYKSPWGTGTLYIFADSRSPSSEYVCRLVIETIGREFKTSNGSLTANLSTAIKAAHMVLLSENRRSLRDHQASVSITCAVVRGSEVFLAQAGRAVAYTLFGGQIARIPTDSSRALSSWSTPLGSDNAIEVSLSRHNVQPGDVLLMASTVLATKPVEGDLPELMAMGPADLLRQLEYYLRDETVFSAFAIGFEAASSKGGQPIVMANEPKEPKEEPKNRRGFTEVVLPAAEGLFGAALSKIRHLPKPPPVDPKRAADALRTFLPDGDNGGESSSNGKPYRSNGKSNGKRQTSASALSKDLPKVVTPVQMMEEQAPAILWSKDLDALEDRYKAILAAPRRSPARSLRLPLVVLLLVLAGLIVFTIVGNFGRLFDSQSEANFQHALSSATITRDRAVKADNLAQSRSLLNDADHLVNDALSIKKNDSKAKALKQKITADLSKLNAVVKLPDTKLLTDLSKVEGSAKTVTNLVVQGEDLFILDRGSSRVFQFGIDLNAGALKVGKSTVVAKKGDKVGDTTVSDLVSILWMDGGTVRQTNNLLVFDSARNLFEYTPGKGLALLKVRGAQSWLNPALAIGYNSNLYILDPSASQVWRYFPTYNGYDSEMRGLLENADIKDAGDFAIDRDIFVLTRGGEVLKFVGGRVETFSQDQLDKPLANPTSLFTTPKTKYVYVLDAGNNRVLVFTKDGKFIRQLVGDALNENPKSIYVDEEKGKIYILANNKLYLSSLPN